MKQFLNASELARIIGVDRATIHRWIRKGRIKGAFRPPDRENWRVPLDTCEELKRQQEDEGSQL
jgi:excisionase family DNA binding protein